MSYSLGSYIYNIDGHVNLDILDIFYLKEHLCSRKDMGILNDKKNKCINIFAYQIYFYWCSAPYLRWQIYSIAWRHIIIIISSSIQTRTWTSIRIEVWSESATFERACWSPTVIWSTSLLSTEPWSLVSHGLVAYTSVTLSPLWRTTTVWSHRQEFCPLSSLL